MIVTCDRCHARYKLDDAKIKGRGAKITCPKCRYIFVVYTPGPDGEVENPEAGPVVDPDTPPAASAPSKPASPPAADTVVNKKRSASDLDFRKVGIATWKVKVRIGLVYDFSDIRTLRKYIQDRRVTEEDVISMDGVEWIRIGDIKDLDEFFVTVYEDHERKQQRPDAPTSSGEFDDGPTMVVGMGSLGANLSTGVFERGTPVDGASVPLTTGGFNSAGFNSGGFSTGDKEKKKRERPSSGDSTQFVDPFVSLKKKQQDQLNHRRPDSKHAPNRGGPQGGNYSAHLLKLGLLAAFVLLGGLFAWWNYANTLGRSDDVDPVLLISAPPSTPGAPVQDDFRKTIQDKIEAELRTGNPIPLEPEIEPGNTGALRPVVPGESVKVPVPPPPVTNSPVVSQAATAADHYAVGEQAVSRGDWRNAAVAYGKAVSMEPGNGTYNYKYGNALLQSGQSAEAQRYLEKSASLGVKSADKALGQLLGNQGDVTGAVEHYRKYLSGNPPDRSAVEEQIRRLTGG